MQVPQDGRYWCEQDGCYVDVPEHRYMMSVMLADATGQAYVTVFNEQVRGAGAHHTHISHYCSLLWPATMACTNAPLSSMWLFQIQSPNSGMPLLTVSASHTALCCPGRNTAGVQCRRGSSKAGERPRGVQKVCVHYIPMVYGVLAASMSTCSVSWCGWQSMHDYVQC